MVLKLKTRYHKLSVKVPLQYAHPVWRSYIFESSPSLLSPHPFPNVRHRRISSNLRRNSDQNISLGLSVEKHGLQCANVLLINCSKVKVTSYLCSTIYATVPEHFEQKEEKVNEYTRTKGKKRERKYLILYNNRKSCKKKSELQTLRASYLNSLT